MTVFFVNSLAFAEQCHTVQQAETLLREIIECFDYLSPALQHKTAVVYHNSECEKRSLIAGEDFLSTINKIPVNKGVDLKKRWFLYAKNRLRSTKTGVINAELSSADVNIAHKINGQIDSFVHLGCCSLISFGGTALLECATLVLVSSAGNTSHANVCNKNMIAAILPQYMPNGKHRKVPYYDYARQEEVAAMPLSDTEAQQLLLQGQEDGGDFLSYHKGSDSFYRFKITGGNVYHGFIVPASQVPAELVRKIKAV